jgi:hypothetical protein
VYSSQGKDLLSEPRGLLNREREGNRTPKGLLFGIVEVCGLLALWLRFSLDFWG